MLWLCYFTHYLSSQDSAEQPTTKKGKTNTKSVAAAREGKKKDADVVEDDEDEEILDLVVEADELAQREPSARAKNARAASSKKAKKRLYDSDDASGSSDHETQEKVRNTKQGKTVKTKAKGGKKMS